MRRRLRPLLAVALVLVVAFASAAGGFLVGRDDPWLLGPFRSTAADPTVDLTAFWEAWNYLRQEYYRQPLDREALVRGAVKGLLASTGDDNTGYLDPQNNQLFRSQLQGEFSGIGAEVDVRDGQIVIVAPLPGSPAERAGVRPGDVVVKIDGEDASKYSLTDATAKIRGPKGSTVTLRVRRLADPNALDETSRQRLLAALPALEDALRADDATRARAAASPVDDALRALAGATLEVDLAIVRDTIVVPRVEERMLDRGLAYLKLSQFSRGASTDVDQALATLVAASPKGLVLDLRGNTGGFVNEAVEIASQFLPSGTLVFSEELASSRHEYRATPGGRALALPLAVLVDRGTASASEILSAALHDNGRATLVGERTFGKGTEQLQHDLADGGGARITIARWLTPKGVWIHHQGIDPDVAVSNPSPPPDLVLERAVQLLAP